MRQSDLYSKLGEALTRALGRDYNVEYTFFQLLQELQEADVMVRCSPGQIQVEVPSCDLPWVVANVCVIKGWTAEVVLRTRQAVRIFPAGQTGSATSPLVLVCYSALPIEKARMDFLGLQEVKARSDQVATFLIP